MTRETKLAVAEKTVNELDCCPVLENKPACDTIDFRYRLPYRVRRNDKQRAPVELVLHFRLERCPGPLVLGDPVYSTTLLPGESVRLFTSDRRSRWSYDSETSLSYRHETTSEESFYAAGMARAMTDLEISEAGASSSSYGETWADGGGEASFSFLGIIKIGGGGGGGAYSSDSAREFAYNLSRHAESASSYVAASVRAKSTTAVGEVETRKHAEGESEAQYESASRSFRNPNKCSAVTYLFHQINKVQRVRFRLVAIERRVVDPAAPTDIAQRVPLDTNGRISVLPQSVPATSSKRLEIEQMGRISLAERLQPKFSVLRGSPVAGYGTVTSNLSAGINLGSEAISENLRAATLKAVDEELEKEGLLDKQGRVSEKLVAELSWEREEIIPTPGIMVKGCLDDCATCEPSLQREIELDLERKELSNALLKRKIELLEQAQEYRCCPPVGGESIDLNSD